jgi:hypothetical protein
MRRASCGNDGAVESLENQKQVFHPSHSSLEISPKPRDSHISTAPTTGIYSGETEATARRIVGCGKVEIQNQDFHFPTAPDALRRKEDSIEEKSVNPNAVYTKLLTPRSAAPFPVPAHQTGRADFRHPAFRLASP